MGAPDILIMLRSMGLTVSANRDRLRVEPKDGVTDKARILIREHRDELLEELSRAASNPQPHDDDRITCQLCTNLYATGTCLAARRLQIKRAAMVYAPIRDILRRCEGYKPKLSDPDQRQGRERWPSLASE